MTDKFLDKAYGLDGISATVDHYDAWSASYDAEVAENGYALPGRMAKAIASLVTDKAAPILDFGCGTGLSGLALRLEQFENLDGMDVSQEMLAQARSKDLYRQLQVIDPTKPPPITPGSYAVIMACGVIGSGAAPLSVLDDLVACLTPGTKLAFSFNDNTLKDPSYVNRVEEILTDGHDLLISEYGEHLPARNMKSHIYIIEKQ